MDNNMCLCEYGIAILIMSHLSQLYIYVFVSFQIQVSSMCMCLMISATVSLTCLFLPKVYLVLFQPYKNVRNATGLSVNRVRFNCWYQGGIFTKFTIPLQPLVYQKQYLKKNNCKNQSNNKIQRYKKSIVENIATLNDCDNFNVLRTVANCVVHVLFKMLQAFWKSRGQSNYVRHSF